MAIKQVPRSSEFPNSGAASISICNAEKGRPDATSQCISLSPKQAI